MDGIRNIRQDDRASERKKRPARSPSQLSGNMRSGPHLPAFSPLPSKASQAYEGALSLRADIEYKT